MRHLLVLLAAAAVMPDLNQLTQMSARFAPVTLKYDAATLSAGDRQALPKLVEAARVLNHLFLDQLWSGNRELYAKLQRDTTPRDRPGGRRVVPRARAPRTLTMASRVQVAITGGGIVGLATGLKLLERAPGLVVVVLEKESRIAAPRPGHNSGVIHSGLYYKPGSEKAKTCVEGRRLLVEFCEKHGVPYEICGKLVVATSESELPALGRGD